MSNYIHYRNFTPNHLARSIVINCSHVRPSWMNQDPYKSNHWPTPASKTYQAVITTYYAVPASALDSTAIVISDVTKECCELNDNEVIVMTTCDEWKYRFDDMYADQF